MHFSGGMMGQSGSICRVLDCLPLKTRKLMRGEDRELQGGMTRIREAEITRELECMSLCSVWCVQSKSRRIDQEQNWVSGANIHVVLIGFAKIRNPNSSLAWGAEVGAGWAVAQGRAEVAMVVEQAF